MKTPTATEFRQLVEQHQSMVFSIAYHVLNDRTAAEDVAQEVFLQLFSQCASLLSPEHVLHWLRRTTLHRAIDYGRRNASHVRHARLDEVAEPATVEREQLSDPILQKRLRELVASLPDSTRMVVVLRYQEDLLPEEISRLLGMPVNTVKSKLQRALAALRERAAVCVGR